MVPTLQNLFDNPRVHGVSFWCTAHACGLRDPESIGTLAIDFGPGETLAGPASITYCRNCGSLVQVSPSWGEGGHNPFNNPKEP